MKRTLKILVAALALQVIILALVSIDRYHVTVKEPFLRVDTTDVDYIKIVNEKGSLVLKKKGVHWRMAEPIDYPANESYVTTLLEKMAELKKETAITRNEDKYVLYELDEPVAKYVEIGKEGGKMDKFYCGKASDTYTHTYIRPAESKEVWLVAGSPRSSFTREPEQWRDKKVLAVEKSMVERICLTTPKETTELIREIASPQRDTTGMVSGLDTTWQAIPSTGKPFTPDDKALNRIFNTLKRLNAIEFLDAGKDTIPSFDNPEFTIEVSMEGNQHEKLEFIPKPDEDTRWLCRRNDDNSTLYVIYQSSVNNLNKNQSELRGEEIDKDTGKPKEMGKSKSLTSKPIKLSPGSGSPPPRD